MTTQKDKKEAHLTKQRRRGAIYGFIVGTALLVMLFGVLPIVFQPVKNIVHGEEIAYHEHVKIDYYVNGKKTDLPQGIGMDIWPTKYLADEGVASYAPIHTHDYSSTVHIEPKINKIYTVADFMQVWGNDKPYKLSSCLGEICTPIEPDNAALQDGDHYKIEQ